MSDDLIRRLDHFYATDLQLEAADRIEALETRLKKAEAERDALREAASGITDAVCDVINQWGDSYEPEEDWERDVNLAMKKLCEADAAKALHDAVLPLAWADVRYTGKYGHATVDVDGEGYESNNAPNPARAWLIAILRALYAHDKS